MAAFARDWAQKRQEAKQTTGRGTFLPLVFDAGEAFQFDWSEDWPVLAGERTKLQVAHFKLSHGLLRPSLETTLAGCPDHPLRAAAS